jgi:cell division protein FtsZ
VVFNQSGEIEFEVVNNITAENESSEIVNETESWETENSSSDEIVASSEENNEIVASVEQPVMDQISEPVAEVTSNPVAELELNLVSEAEVKASVAAEEEERVKKLQQEEQMRKAQERIMKLKELSMKLKTPNGLSELENEPAYKRRNVSLDNEQHSSESSVSRFTLSENDEKKIEIRPNNSFLHDNVD